MRLNDEQSLTIYELVGGEETFRRLVDIFYDRLAADPVVGSMFPEDLTEAKRWQYLFLVQFFGGPAGYADERGHPRLRMRHAPFAINQAARDAWLGHMLAAMDEIGIDEPMRTMMRSYFIRASEHMMNTDTD